MAIASKIGGQIYGVLAIIVLVLSTTVFFVPFFIIGLLKLLPINGWQIFCTQIINHLVSGWVSVNSAYINATQRITWQINGLDTLDKNQWYLITANHQSWADIVILQHIFNYKIPALKFFIKDELKWVPLLGFSWWAMGCPFMKRYTKDYLLKYPHKKGDDLRATKKALRLFEQIPTAIINFVEGTRFNPHKSQLQQSPYQHLLKPRAGGISFVISALSSRITTILDTTIIYENNNHTLWDLLCHRIDSITIDLRTLTIPNYFTNDTWLDDPLMQEKFRQWLNDRWLEKDSIISSYRHNQ